jgi:hypothetical protein
MALTALETALEAEHRRQMEMMAQRMKERGSDIDQERVRREIKMAMLMKAKEAKQQANAGSSSTSGFNGFKQVGILSKADEWRQCIEKAEVMKFGPIYKKPYMTSKCNQVAIRIEYQRKVELERKYAGYKDDIFEIIANAQQMQGSILGVPGLPTSNDAESYMDDLISQFSVTNLTFKDLIDHVTNIESNYNTLQQLINPVPPSEALKIGNPPT